MTAVAVERLPGLLGHELRNPLASAVTGTMLLRELTDADDPRAAVLDGIVRDLERVTALTDGWLELARTGQVATTRFLVADLVQEVASRHGAEVVVCPAAIEVVGNRALLARALDNLCENGRQAGARTIRIAVQSLGDAVSVHVEDDGRGIEPGDVERVFTPGWSSRGSSGLGLHGVAATLAAHGGTIRCVPLARGTRFSLGLPAAGHLAAMA